MMGKWKKNQFLNVSFITTMKCKLLIQTVNLNNINCVKYRLSIKISKDSILIVNFLNVESLKITISIVEHKLHFYILLIF